MIGQIEESYVVLETAKLLKEKGFDYRCRKYYIDDSMFEHTHGEIIPKNYDIYECPTQQMAMRWLREVHNCFIQIKYANGCTSFSFYVYTNRTDCYEHNLYYNSYEEAVEGAIQHCLMYLI